MILTEEQCLVRDTARAFAADRLAPHSAEWERQAHFPREVFREMGQLGLMAVTVPETWGGSGADASAARVTRVPAGHPEGYLEGFANIYSEAAAAIRARREKNGRIPKDVLYPTVQDGLDGMRFIDACVRSSARNTAWTKL